MKCPICNNTLINLRDDLFRCKSNIEMHVFMLNLNKPSTEDHGNLMCIYPKEHEDNSYPITCLDIDK